MLNYVDVFNAYIVINQNKPELLKDFRSALNESESSLFNGLLNISEMMKAISLLEDENKKDYITDNLLFGLGDIFSENIKILQAINSANSVAYFYLNQLPEEQKTKYLNISGGKE